MLLWWSREGGASADTLQEARPPPRGGGPLSFHRTPGWLFMVCSRVYKLRLPFPYISPWLYLQIGELCKEAEIELVSIYCPLLLLSPVVRPLFVLHQRKVT